LLVGLFVGERDGGAEFDRLARQLGNVDHLGARDLVLELHEATLDEALALACRVVLGILGDVAVVARLGNLLDDRRPIDALDSLQLFLETVESVSRHRDPAGIHGLQLLPVREASTTVKKPPPDRGVGSGNRPLSSYAGPFPATLDAERA